MLFFNVLFCFLVCIVVLLMMVFSVFVMGNCFSLSLKFFCLIWASCKIFLIWLLRCLFCFLMMVVQCSSFGLFCILGVFWKIFVEIFMVEMGVLNLCVILLMKFFCSLDSCFCCSMIYMEQVKKIRMIIRMVEKKMESCILFSRQLDWLGNLMLK